ncbi:hypothetical protein, partial, partial [Parasitella parasitica]
MSRMTRKTNTAESYCGHYELTGSMWSKVNMEFTQMLHGGSLGIPILENIMQDIDVNKDNATHYTLQKSMLCNLVNRADVNAAQQWYHNYVFSNESVTPNATRHNFEQLILGHDERDHSRVEYGNCPAVLAEIFPYLYTQGRGYYSFATHKGAITNLEPTGGISLANMRGE